MKERTQYVIRRQDGKFWADIGRWSAEYPDAHLFGSWKNAAQEAMDSTGLMESSEVIADYGTDAERVILTVPGQILGEKAALLNNIQELQTFLAQKKIKP